MDMEYNILCCNVGRRGRLMLDFRRSLAGKGKVIGTGGESRKGRLYVYTETYL